MAKFVAKKLNVTIREDLLERMDEFADLNGMTRSGLIAVAVTQYLNAVEAMPSVNKLLAAMSAVSDGVLKGEISPSEAELRLAAIKSTYDELTRRP